MIEDEDLLALLRAAPLCSAGLSANLGHSNRSMAATSGRKSLRRSSPNAGISSPSRRFFPGTLALLVSGRGEVIVPAQLVPLVAGAGPLIPIQQPVLLVGRHPEADIRVESATISRRHCCLAVVYDRVMIRDLGSRHGVFVNGVRVDEAQIQPGDEIAIAHLLYRFEATAAATGPKPLDFAAPAVEEGEAELVPFDD